MEYLLRTHYSTHFTQWIKRIVLILGILMVSGFWFFTDDEPELLWLILPVLIVVFTVLLFSPVEDLAISETEFFFLQTSPLKALGKVQRFEIARISSIDYAMSLGMSDQNKNQTTVRITFKDGSMESFKTSILRKDVEVYVGKVREMIS